MHFIDAVTNISRWKFQGDRSFGVAMTSIQAFSEAMSLDVTWWPDLEWPGSKILHNMCGKDVCTGVPAPPFSRYVREKPEGGVFKHPHRTFFLTIAQECYIAVICHIWCSSVCIVEEFSVKARNERKDTISERVSFFKTDDNLKSIPSIRIFCM